MDKMNDFSLKLNPVDTMNNSGVGVDLNDSKS